MFTTMFYEAVGVVFMTAYACVFCAAISIPIVDAIVDKFDDYTWEKRFNEMDELGQINERKKWDAYYFGEGA